MRARPRSARARTERNKRQAPTQWECAELCPRTVTREAGVPNPGRKRSFRPDTLGPMAQAPALPRGFELPLAPRMPRIGSVDAVALEERAATLAKRSIKRESKVWALELAIRMMDLTTLEGTDTPGKVAALASKAMRPTRPTRDPAGRRRLRVSEPRPTARRAARGHRA